MTPQLFIDKWSKAELKERSAAQEHFIDLCRLLDEKTPAEADPTGETYSFEKGAVRTTGAGGWADVWKQGCFGWEYKGPGKDLDKAFGQLLTYSVALENPPLLIVSDLRRIVVRTNWTNTVQKMWDISLEDLRDASKRQILKDAFSNPEALKPAKTRQELTEEAAKDFAAIAKALRERGHDAERVAHFVNRMVFCMFAEDVQLLPGNIFTKMLERGLASPEDFVTYAKTLFSAMRDKGGMVGFDRIEWFNGGLFDDDEALELSKDEIRTALSAAKLDWSDVDASILGTLFERGLDPDKRSQLGAHYTDRDKIMMILNPVIVEPLTREWDEVRAEMQALMDEHENIQAQIRAIGDEAGSADVHSAKKGEEARRKRAKALRAKATKAYKAAEDKIAEFRLRLRNFRVLDPACGSGNFLNLALVALKDIEHKANLDAEAMGLPRVPPQVGPECVKGIEINPYAAELARVSIWIGEIQWMRRNGFSASRNPILRPLGAIECADALVEQNPETGEWREKAWPEADVIVGNPPFLGDKRMISVLGEDYVSKLRKLYADRVPGGADIVTYWFAKAWEAIEAETLVRAGLVATNSIRGGANRKVLQPIAARSSISHAWPDEPWVVDGAAVRVSIVVFEREVVGLRLLDSQPVADITSALEANHGTYDLSEATPLEQMTGLAFQGPVLVGSFDIRRELAASFLSAPANADGSNNGRVVRPLRNGMDINRRPREYWVINFGTRSEEEAALFEAPFEYVREQVKPYREKNRDLGRRKHWWRLGRSGQEFDRAIEPLSRFIARSQVSKHHIFVWLPRVIQPHQTVIAIARDDDTTFGILHSRFHELWSLRMGTSLEDRPRYTPTTTFETFPFPKGLTPDIPASDYAAEPRAQKIAAAAARLNELRENWLNPPDLVRREPEVVPGYPDRILPVDEAAAAILKKRTLTNLYNLRPSWLEHAHRELDAAVAEAYGWPADLSEDDILAKLFALNQERAAKP